MLLSLKFFRRIEPFSHGPHPSYKRASPPLTLIIICLHLQALRLFLPEIKKTIGQLDFKSCMF